MRPWIEKQRHILDYTIASLLRRKAKNASLLVVYTLVVFVLASTVFFTYAIKREASLILTSAPEMVVQRMLGGRYDPIPVSYLEKIRSIRGVASAEARLWAYYFDPATGANYTLLVPDKSPPGPDEMIIGSGISRTRGVYQGDMISFRSADGTHRTFSVAGVLPSASELVSADQILVNESDFRSFYTFPATLATDLIVRVRNPRELRTIAKKVTEILPDTRPIIRDEMIRTYDSVFDWRSSMITVLAAMALLAFVIFSWDRASGLSAEERREIGILKAVGWETADVIAVKTFEGLFISLFSFCAGVILAYAHIFFFSGFLFAPALKGWSVLYPDFRLTPFIDPYQIALLFFLTVVPYTAATIIPSWKASIVDPDTVMRT